jgi:transcriptional regulator with XRE-family HTH domain
VPYTLARVADQARAAGPDARFRSELRLTIRRARERLQMSQEEFARALGEFLGHPVSQSQISDWERGRFEPGASILLAVAEMADLSIDELRSAGPPALVERLERLEAEVERMADSSRPDAHVTIDPNAGFEERLAALERETGRMGALLAQMIQALDKAELWPTSEAPGATTKPSTAKGAGPQ